MLVKLEDLEGCALFVDPGQVVAVNRRRSGEEPNSSYVTLRTGGAFAARGLPAEVYERLFPPVMMAAPTD